MGGNGTAVGVEIKKLVRKDFVSDQEVRWCPGCGDYSILAQMQKVLPDLGIPREKIVFVSGIGCSSRFPYYMNTYGFHTIHGRAPAVATGIKMANPDLNVWVITGDGDGLSIGGNHLMHAIRRNVDLNILLFNNRIYGLTKGQYSPTSEIGKKTKSTPYGSIERPINPLGFAIGAEATFVARSIDVDTKHLCMVLERAARHKGTSFVEIFQNCNIFNDGAFAQFTDRQHRPDRVLYLENGKPLQFGKDNEKGIMLKNIHPHVVDIGMEYSVEDLVVHDESQNEPTLAYLLSRMHIPDFPVPVGIFRAVERPEYATLMQEQIEEVSEKEGPGILEELLIGKETWVVEDEETTTGILMPETETEEEFATTVPESAYRATEEPADRVLQSILNDSLSDLYAIDPIRVSPTESIASVMAKLVESRHGAACVVDNGIIIGIFTERDAVTRVAGMDMDVETTPISKVMTSDPYVLSKDSTLAAAVNQMSDGGLRHIPIVENGNLVGISTVRGVLAHIAENALH